MSALNLRAVGVVLAVVVGMCFGPSSSDATPHRRVVADGVTRDVPMRIATGRDHSCQVVDDGSVRCWGSNSDGRLGDGTIVDRPSPVVVGGLINITAVAAGFSHTCALQGDGRVWCWGDNLSSQMGDGTNL